ncbi:sodium-dependent phosphate transport protein 2B-like [Gigantopelta aegis]|uniref:sodium-dependent phosphate transport protein 2B-like n=1 Tax=Gigantopelta aegis TaxID=1735272 RepID=UPI001B887F1A|nr:sodium-dependent phosphate transport protein 2B-like [Gigantopelta aegis]
MMSNQRSNANSVFDDTTVSTNSFVEAEVTRKEEDPWSLTAEIANSQPWSELSACGTLKRVLWVVVRVMLVLGFLYMFICSLDFLSSAFRLLGGKAAGKALSDVELLTNPIAGVTIGVLATILVQSSSTSTSIVVSMVSADRTFTNSHVIFSISGCQAFIIGRPRICYLLTDWLLFVPTEVLTVRLSIPIVMGANIGTTITNLLVSLSQASDRTTFRRAFAAANIHDMFNWLTMMVFLPLEVATGYLYYLSGVLVANIENDPDLDLNVITRIAKGDNVTGSLIKFCCKKIPIDNDTLTTTALTKVNTSFSDDLPLYRCEQKCDHLFSHTELSETDVGLIILFVALVMLAVCLILIVKILHSLLHGSIASIIKRVVNADFPGYAKFLTGYFAILIGAGLTFLVQSSSILTSTLTPLVGLGVIHIDRVFPLALGANIGTTATSILAALASDGAGIQNSLRIAFCHLFFNISGVLLWYTLPFMRKIPIGIAKTLGGVVAEYRWFAVVYVMFVFIVFPVTVLGLSVAGWEVVVGVGCPVLAVVIFVVIVNVLQRKANSCLPTRLRTWENTGLPVWLRSLQPYDEKIVSMQHRFRKAVGKKDNGKIKTMENDLEMRRDVTPGHDNECFNLEITVL